MSFDNDNFNNDSNQFSRSARRRGGDQDWNDDTTSNPTLADSTYGGQGQNDPNWSTNQDTFGSTGKGGQGLGYQGSGNATYAGDTQDVNVPGAGSAGGFNRSGASNRQWDDNSYSGGATGGAGGLGATGTSGDQWDDNDGAGNQYGSGTQYGSDQQGSGTGRAGGKPSMTDRLKGNMEKAAGKIAGRQDIVERGQERKTGDTFDSSNY